MTGNIRICTPVQYMLTEMKNYEDSDKIFLVKYFFNRVAPDSYRDNIQTCFMRKKIQHAIILFALAPIFILSCQKENKELPNTEEIATAPNNNKEHGHLQQTKTFSADVVIRWLNMQLEMLRVPAPAGVAAPVSGRALAYCGIALYEAVEPGMPAYQTLSGQLNGLPSIPATEPGKAYHWAASANAALAYM